MSGEQQVTAAAAKTDAKNGVHKNSFVLYKRRWLILAVFSLISMTNEVIWISLSSITSIVKDYYGVSSVAVNWLSMIFMVCFVFVLISAYALTKQGLKFTIVIGTVLNGIGSCLRLIGSTRDGFAFAFAGNAFAALAQCFLLFVPPTLAAAWFGEKERATASAIGMLMNMFGVALGFLMGGLMVPSSEDSAAVANGMFQMLLVQSAVCTFLVIVCVVVVQDAPKTPPSMSQALMESVNKLKAEQKSRTRRDRVAKSDTVNTGVESAGKKSEQEFLRITPFTIFEFKDVLHQSEHAPVEAATHNRPVSDAAAPKAEHDTSKLAAVSFYKSIKTLVKNKDFHLLTQAYGFYFGLFAACNTILNQMCVIDFPGEEKTIGLMGFTSILLGMCAIFVAGVWIDKTRRYKLISVVVTSCCATSMLVFTLVLVYSGSMYGVFVAFCVYGFFSYPYMTVGLEHAADLTYPISEGTTSGILLLVGNLYGVIFTYVLGAVLDQGWADVAGYIMTGCYALSVIGVCLVSRKLKRTEADMMRKKVLT